MTLLHEERRGSTCCKRGSARYRVLCTWDIIEIPKNKKVVECKRVFTAKYNFDRNINRYKARLIGQGFTNIDIRIKKLKISSID